MESSTSSSVAHSRRAPKRPQKGHHSVLSTGSPNKRQSAADSQSRLLLLASKSKEAADDLARQIESTIKESRELRREMAAESAQATKQTSLTSELVAANKRMSTQISTFLSLLSTKANKSIRSLDAAAKLFEEVWESSASFDSDMSRRLRETEEALAKEKQLRKQAEQALRAERTEVAPERDGSAQLRKKYQRKIGKLVDVVERQNREIQVLRDEVARKKSGSEVSESMKRVYEENIRRITAKTNEIERLIAQKDDIQEQLENANREVNAECTELECQVSDLKALLREKDEEVRNWRNVTRKWKEENQKTVSVAKMLETDVAQCQTRIQELELKLSEARVGQTAPIVIEQTNLEAIDKEIEALKSSISALESLLEEQSTEIEELHRQRSELISNMAHITQYLGLCDVLLQESKKDTEQVVEENKRVKRERVEHERQEQERFNTAIDDIAVLVPSIAGDVPMLKSAPRPEAFSMCMARLVQQIDKAKADAAKQKEIEINELWKKRHAAVLHHLDSAYRFLRNAANSRPLSEHDKTSILTECVRLGKYLEEHQVTLPDYSIFNPTDLNTPAKVARVFTDLVSEESLQESPLRELYTLFMCLTQVNSILMHNIEANEQFVKEAQRLKAQEQDQREMLTNLEHWKNRHTIVYNTLAPLFKQYVKSDDCSFEEMAEKFVTAFNNGEISCKERERLNANVDDLTNQLDILQKTIEAQDKQIVRDRKQFCKRADALADEIQMQVTEEKAAHEQENRQLQALVSKLQAELKESQAMYQQFSQSAGKRLKKRKEVLRVLTDETGTLRSRAAELQATVSELAAENSKLNDQLQETNEQLASASEDARLQKEKKKNYKSRLLEEEKKNNATLSELLKRNSDLSNKYTGWVSNLESENRELKEQILKTSEESKTLQESKQEIRAVNAQLQAQNRSLHLKVDSLTHALERERNAVVVKQNAISAAKNAKCDRELEKLKSLVDRCRDVMIKLLQQEFHMEGYGTTTDDLITAVNLAIGKRSSEQFLFEDIKRVRRIFDLSPDQSVAELFQRTRNELETLKESSTAMEAENKRLRNNNTVVTKQNEELKQVKSQADNWLLWARSLLRQLSASASTSMSCEDVRYALEEAVLSSIGHDTMRRKLETLRAEKQLLKSERIRSVPVSHQKISSIRPAIVALIFAKRLVEISGSLPMRFGNLTKRDLPDAAPPSAVPVVPVMNG